MNVWIRGFTIRVVWTKTHTILEGKAKMTLENRQVAWANEKADELAKRATQDGAEVAERIAEEALATRTKGCMRLSDTQPPSMMELRS